jgi:hypothetical protein
MIENEDTLRRTMMADPAFPSWLLVIPAAGLVLLAGVAFGLYWYFGRSDDEG